MYLKKIEIQGFKSFAHKTTLEFDQGISAIVGPNGSGKSNIADAVRWVLGEQSLKLLRGKKSQDVIFSGSNKKSRLGMAEVNIFIDNKNHRTPIDYTDLIITRRVYQNGEGEYFINHQRCRLQDIILLLAKANVGQKSYSVIGQGMIESILTSSPQERKDFFDEAAGVKQYQIKREQANLKLEHTKKNLSQAEVLLQEIEPRLRSLTRQVKRLERRESMEKELKKIQHTHYSLLWSELVKQYEIQKKDYQAQHLQLKKLEEEREFIQKDINGIAKADTRIELFQKYQQDYQILTEEKNKLLQEQVVLQGKTELFSIQKGRSDLAWFVKKSSELKQTKERLEKEIISITQRLVRERSNLEQSMQEQNRISEEFSQLEQKLTRGFEKLNKKPELDLPIIKEAIEKIYIKQQDFWQKFEKCIKLEDFLPIKQVAKQIFNELKSLKEKLSILQSEQDSQELAAIQESLSALLKIKDKLVNEISETKFQIRSLEEKNNLLDREIKKIVEEKKKIEAELNLHEASVQDPTAIGRLIKEQEAALKEKINNLDEKIKIAQIKLNSFNQEEQFKKDQLVKFQQAIQEKQQNLNEITNFLNETNIKIAKIETKKEDLEKEIQENLGWDDFQAILHNKIEKDLTITEITYSERVESIQKLKHQLELVGGIDPAIQEEYKTTYERYHFLKTQTDDLKEASKSLEKIIEELDEKIKKQFKLAFGRINEEFSKYFKMLFRGGKASLTLKKEIVIPEEQIIEAAEENLEEVPAQKDQKDIIENKLVVSGIDIHACPPGKKLSDLNMLSGGEKALTAIALLCAIIANNPPPFSILDEVDAALDEANSLKYAKILEELAHQTQFVTITHNRATMHQATILYGVTMGDDGISKLLSIKMEEAEKIKGLR